MTRQAPAAGPRARAVRALFFSSCRHHRLSATPTTSRLPRALVACLAAALVAAACGSQDDSPLAAAPVEPAPATASEAAPEASSRASSTPEGETTSPAPDVSVPDAAIPDAAVPEVSVPDAAVPDAAVPEVSVPDAAVPEVSVPDAAIPDAAVPAVSVPDAAVPEVSVPQVSVPTVGLPVAAEYDPGYDRDDWGPHHSDLCRGAAGSPDPYTGTPIDTCNVDHVVALQEAHQSGGWAWSGNEKQRFSQAPENHLASRACVNQSKGGDDISEWSDADIASSSACGGGYTVTPAGRCVLARVTVAVKSAWGLAVDQAEADALGRTLSGCGDQAPGFSAEPAAATPTSAPTTTVAPPDECVIAGKAAAQYDAVPGIGEVLSARLVDAQPFSSRSQLEAVRGIGPVKAEAVWSHFCSS